MLRITQHCIIGFCFIDIFQRFSQNTTSLLSWIDELDEVNHDENFSPKVSTRLSTVLSSFPIWSVDSQILKLSPDFRNPPGFFSRFLSN